MDILCYCVVKHDSVVVLSLLNPDAGAGMGHAPSVTDWTNDETSRIAESGSFLCVKTGQ